MIPKAHKNIFALAIGFFLIILVSSLIFIKPFLKKKNKNENGYNNQTVLSHQKARAITSDELLEKMINKEKMVVIDVRSKEDYIREHLIDSQNIPGEKIAAALPALDKSKTYILIDDGTSQEAAVIAGNFFSKQEFPNVFYLAGGFAGWKSKYNPTVSDGDPNSFVDQSKVTYVASDKLKEMLNKESNLFLIDLRKNNQFSEGHLRGAVNIFLDDLEQKRNQIPLGKKIVLYDNDGLWAFKGAVRLYDLGFFNVLAFSDGLNAWKQKGFEIIK